MCPGTRNPGRLILASASPRRRELLGQLGLDFSVRVADVDEAPRAGEHPAVYVQRLALAKARAGARLAGPGSAVLGADTAVVLGTRILGKPGGREEALEMLGALSGTEHEVFSAVALLAAGSTGARLSVSRVRFRTIGAWERERYWESGEPADKAGGYAIQGLGAVFVEHLQGSFSGVMGLPLFETAELLRCMGIDPLGGTDVPPVQGPHGGAGVFR